MIKSQTYLKSGDNFKVKCYEISIFYKGYLSLFEDDEVTVILMHDKAQSAGEDDPLGRRI